MLNIKGINNLHLTHHEAHGNAAIDPLNEDLTTIVSSFPVLAAGQLAEFKVVESSVKESEDPAKAARWSVCLSPLNDGLLDVEGKPLTANHKSYISCQLAPSGKATVEIVKSSFKAQAEVADAVVAGRNIGNIRDWVKSVEGNIVRLKTKVRPARKDPKTGAEYSASNEFVRVK